MTKILVSLVTLENPDWRKNIADLKRFGIAEFAIFLTVMKDGAERMALMQAVKAEIPAAHIPFAHIRPDMAPSELDFLIENFGTKKMNIHPTSQFPLVHDYSKYLDKIYIENAGRFIRDGLNEENVEGFAGICLDLSHLENARLTDPEGYKKNIAIAEKYDVGANHISAIKDYQTYYEDSGISSYDSHNLVELKELDYLKNYYPKYFGEFAAIELINDIETQIKAKAYIEKMLGL